MDAAAWIKLAGVILAAVTGIVGPTVYLAVRLAIRAEVDPLAERIEANRDRAEIARERANDAHDRLNRLQTDKA